jgi:mono/diheme cytochrome c family protein
MSRRPALLLAFAVLTGGACRQDMHDQPKYKPYRYSDFFGDDRSERPQVEDTVARGQLHEDDDTYLGKTGTVFAARFPMPVTEAVLTRGQERFTIYCTPCHGQTGRGDGYVVQRGYRRPPSFHIDRLRSQPPGYFFDVITNGFGVMPDYASQVPVEDRWAIVAYLRALQLSENVPLAEVPADVQSRLQAEPALPPSGPAAGGVK